MSQNSRPLPELIREEGEMQIFRWPDTGEEFATTISKPIADEKLDPQHVTVVYEPLVGDGAKQAVILSGIFREVESVEPKFILEKLKLGRSIAIHKVPLWRAEAICSLARSKGVSLKLIKKESGSSSP